MTNIERLRMAIEGIEITDFKLYIYLEENGFNVNDPLYEEDYNPASSTNKKQIYKTALAILEDIANNPNTMKNFKSDDISISNFAENLQSRINQLEKKIRQIPSDNEVISNIDSGSNFVYMFSN